MMKFGEHERRPRVEVEDRISHLPTAMALHILSFLSLKDAAATSTLSSNWSHLWLSAHKDLDFDASLVIPEMELIKQLEVSAEDVIALMPKYVGWVNQVLSSHRSMAIDKFRIFFVLDESHAEDITQWLRHAFARKVQSLELDIASVFCPQVVIDSPYILPQHLFEEFPDEHLKFLMSLSLSGVYLTQQVVSTVLRKCRFLESLKLYDMFGLSRLAICGPSLALKHLDVTYCWGVKCITVRDACCLVSLKVTEVDSLVVENVPKLVDAFLISSWEIQKMLATISSNLSKLEALTLDLHRVEKVTEVPELPELKELYLIFGGDSKKNFVLLTQIISSSPKLEKLVLQYQWKSVKFMSRGVTELRKGLKLPLQHLKVVELIGYFGQAKEDELLMYLLDNSLALKKITVSPRDPNPDPYSDVQNRDDAELLEEEKAKECAEKLKELIPASVEFLIL